MKPLAILATVDLRPKPLGSVPTTEAEPVAPGSDNIPRPAQVSLI